MNVLMVGVDKNRKGGMWTVAEMFIEDRRYNKEVNLYYVSTSTGGTAIKRALKMVDGYIRILITLLFHKIDIVHIHMAEKGSTYRKGMVAKWGKHFKKKVIIQMHAGPFMDWYTSLPTKQQIRIKQIFRNADIVLALGEFWKNQLKSIIDIDKIKVVYNGAFCPGVRKYNKAGTNIVFLGLLKRGKGIYDLLDAIQIIDSRLSSDIQVLLCGEDVEGDISSVIDKKNLTMRVKMMGWISKSERDEIFSNTQLCVLPSYAEALSMVVIESMCYGIPIITTNITTMPELIGDEMQLVEPGNIEQLANSILYYSCNENEREKSSIGLYKRAKKTFTTDKIIDDVLKLYNSILENEEQQ